MQNNKNPSNDIFEDLLAEVEDAAVMYLLIQYGFNDDPFIITDALLYFGLAGILFEITDSPEDVRLICETALMLYRYDVNSQPLGKG